ncbi:CHAT domain-containing protein [Streptomyces sp. BH-SS-21]|uniref:CHAT domain-containing protein n=1 Tax=Streptomyces liliiviolaceus TaxID=2823109 RepID=A0A940XUK8_9ACTN|nr:CHAT domain-containing protein [Streptomyces liliiviolaceus]MBQ0850205.1 CHAT domain-containing protein [Streptomyces liliiviolaceus]
MAALLAALQARLAALAECGDAAPLLDDMAARQARVLVAALPPECRDPDAEPAILEALRVAALVHWNRYCLSGEDSRDEEEDDDFAAAVALFSRIHRRDPLAVPDPLLPLIDTSADPGQQESPVTWSGMAQPYLDRYGSTRDPADLRTAVQLLSAALDGAPEASPDRPLILLQFTEALLSLYEDTGDEEALTVCLDTARAETQLTRTVNGSMAWTVLSVALLARFGHKRDPAGFEEAVHAARRAVQAALDGASRAHTSGDLGAVLYETFSRTGDERALSEALSFLREALTQTPPGSPEYPARLHVLGQALLGWHNRTGDPAGLGEAMRAAREAATLIPEDHAHRADMLAGLAAALQERFHHAGHQEDLFEAVRLRRSILTSLPSTDPGHPAAAAQISTALWLLHQHIGDSAALTEAIAYARTAVESMPEDHQVQAGRMSNLAAMLRARFLNGGAREDLDEAITLLRAAIPLLAPGHPERAAQLSNLANALRSRHTLTSDPSMLAEAVEAARTAVESTPGDHPAWPARLGNLGAILRTRFECGAGAVDDLDETIGLLRMAVAALPYKHSGRAAQLANLGNALRLRHDHARDPQDAAEGRMALWAAAEPPDAPPLIRMRAAWAYADAARRDGDSAETVKGFELAVGLLPRIAPPSLSRDDREYRLGRLAGLGSEAAAAALDAGRPGLALELLEQARGILLGEVLTARGELEELAEREPALYAEFQRLRDALSAPEADADARLSGGMRFEETIARIRALPGFSRFLLPLTVDDLRPDPDDGPVIVVNVAGHRSDALVLGAGPRDALHVIPLPGLTPDELATHVNNFHRKVWGAQSQVSQTLAWLWDSAVGPVLESLGVTATPANDGPWPRVWWCPVGLLACLPLHAAGRHQDGGDSALDRVVSSYTPTVQALAASRRRARRELPHLAGRHGRALVVAMPNTPGVPPLPYAHQEAEAVAQMMPQTTLLADGEASRATVLSELGQHPIVHFACHGVTDWQDPSANRLVLADGALSVRDLLHHRLDGTRLVMLSACSSSAAGERLPDEAVHLASSFLAAGAAHVVGTLWAVEDQVAARTATTLYTHLTAAGTLPPRTGLTAIALHVATRRLREQYPGSPGLWAPFMHIGV